MHTHELYTCSLSVDAADLVSKPVQANMGNKHYQYGAVIPAHLRGLQMPVVPRAQ